MQKYSDGVDDIVSHALDGLFQGLEDNDADSVVKRLTQTIVDAAINSTKSIDLDSLKMRLADVIKSGVRDGVLDEENLLKFRVQMGLVMDVVDEKLVQLIANSGDQLKKSAVDNLIAIKEELFKDNSKQLIRELMQSVLAGLKEGYASELKPEFFEALDSLEATGKRILEDTGNKVDKLKEKARIYWWIIIGVVVAAGLLSFYLRWRTIQTRLALVAALKGVDSIASKKIYDQTKMAIQSYSSVQSNDLIVKTLKKYDDSFDKKKEYKRNELFGLRLVLKHLDRRRHARLINQVLKEAREIDSKAKEEAEKTGKPHAELETFLKEEIDKPTEL